MDSGKAGQAIVEFFFATVPVAITGLIAFLTPLSLGDGQDAVLLGIVLAVLKGGLWFLTGTNARSA